MTPAVAVDALLPRLRRGEPDAFECLVRRSLMKLRTKRRRPEESIEDLLPTFLEDGHHARHAHE